MDWRCVRRKRWKSGVGIFRARGRELGQQTSIIFKEFRVGSGSLQVKLFGGSGVDQHPIGFDMRISVSSPIEFERMVFVRRGQGISREQKLDQRFQLFEVFASLLKPLHVAMKLA